MTDKEIKTEFIHIHGKLFAIMEAMAMLMHKEFNGGIAEASRIMNEAADTQTRILLNVLEARDLGDKKQ